MPKASDFVYEEDTGSTHDDEGQALTEQSQQKPDDDKSKNPYDWGQDDEDEKGNDEDLSDDADPLEEEDSADDDSGGVQQPVAVAKQPDFELIARATAAGLQPSEIAGLAQQGSLDSTVSVLERTAKSNTKDEDEFKKLDLNLDPEVYDEDVIELFNKVNDHYFEQTKATREKLRSIEEQSAKERETQQQIEQERFINWIDKEFIALGKQSKDHEEIFGTKSVGGLTNTDVEFQNRVKVVNEINAQRAAHPEFTDAQLLDAAIKIALSDELTKIAAKATKSKVKEHRNNRVSNRSTRKGDKTHVIQDKGRGSKAATRWVAAKLKKLGLGG